MAHFLPGPDSCIRLMRLMSITNPRLLLLLLPVLLLGCSGARVAPPAGASVPAPDGLDTVAELLAQADRSSPTEAGTLRLQAVELLLDDQQLAPAQRLLADLAPMAAGDATLALRFVLARARLDRELGEPAAVLNALEQYPADQLAGQEAALVQRYRELRASALQQTGQSVAAARELIRLNAAGTQADLAVPNLIWNLLQGLADTELAAMAGTADSYEQRGWVELARVVRNNQASVRSQLDAIERWRTVWAQHSALTRLPEQLVSLQAIWDQRPRHIALLLPLQDQVGRAVQEGFLGAYYEALQLGIEVPRLSVYDTTPLLDPGAPQDIYGLYDTAVTAGADLVIGPLDKALVRQLQSMENLPVPTLALNYTDNALRYSPNFYQFGLAPEDEIRQVADLARAAGLTNAAIIAPAGNDYLRLQDAFSGYWQSLGGEVVSRATFSGDNEFPQVIKHLLGIDASESRAARITGLLPRSTVEFTPRRRQDIDFIYVMANPRQGRQIKPTLAFYFAGDIPVYSLSAIYDGLERESQRANQDLNGVIFTDTPWVLTGQDPLKQQVVQHLRGTQGPLQRLRALGVDSFRLYTRLPQLANGEITGYSGATGSLSMTSFGAIQRRTSNAVFEDGMPRLLPTGQLAARLP